LRVAPESAPRLTPTDEVIGAARDGSTAMVARVRR
jgi:hypothetical protein